jgi:hypothetical protein
MIVVIAVAAVIVAIAVIVVAAVIVVDFEGIFVEIDFDCYY